MANRFRYQLESLKKLRELKLNMAKAELAQISSAINDANQKIVESRSEVSQLLDEQRQTSDVSYVKLFSYLTTNEQDKINKEMRNKEILQLELDRHSAYVSFLRTELKAVELHENIKKEEFNKEIEKHEAKKNDEINSIMWGRKAKDFK